MWKKLLFSFNLAEMSSFLKQAPLETHGVLWNLEWRPNGSHSDVKVQTERRTNVFSKKCKAYISRLYVIQEG